LGGRFAVHVVKKTNNILLFLSYEIGVDCCALYSWRNRIWRDSVVVLILVSRASNLLAL